ncbi:hypothetical protein BDW59DRAFT_164702 [Aspergillus cavernicola]|uniref:Uncharacterized protein n=1 Tax=Aspergillus cavernicola TaxID=176166 RepID=A0ABR4HXR1_9EURO
MRAPSFPRRRLKASWLILMFITNASFKCVHRTPEGKQEDTPLFSLYRLYESLILNDNDGLRNEIEYFWYARWPVASIPNPHDPSGSRYAVLSAIPALLVESFNQRTELGLPRKADAIVSREELEQYQKEDKIFDLGVGAEVDESGGAVKKDPGNCA